MKKRTFHLICVLGILVWGIMIPSPLVLGDSDSGFVFPQYSKKVSLDFKNADLKDVLKAFSKQVSMNFLLEHNVDVKGITVLLSDVPVEEALEKILTAYGLVYEYEVSNNLFLVKNKPKEEVPVVIMTRIYQLKFASVSGSALMSQLGSSGGTEGGGGGGSSLLAALKTAVKGKDSSIVEDARTNSLIITASKDSFPDVERILARLDVPVSIVLIEVEMLDISKDTSDKIGIMWDITGPVQFATNISYSFKDITGSGPTLDGKININGVGDLLDFLKAQRETRSLAKPRIMTLDNQTANIEISSDEAIGESLEQTGTGNSTVTKYTAERAKTGVFLLVTPQVSLLTDEITLAIEPKVSDASQSVVFKSGTEFRNPVDRKSKSILRVKSGETIILGGLLRKYEEETTQKIPFFSDIPLLGALFKGEQSTKQDRELVIFITPRIIGSSDLDSADQKKIAEGVLKGEQSILDLRTKSISQEMDRISDK